MESIRYHHLQGASNILIMSTIFSWNPKEFDYLLESCDVDPLTPYMMRYFSNKNGAILEAGCGAGRYVKYLSDRKFCCEGIEYNGATVQAVQKKWPDLNIVQGDVENMSYSNGYFQYIISIGVVEHFIEGPHKPLLEMLRVLKPGGIALITVPCLNGIRRLKGPFCGISHLLKSNPLLRSFFGKKTLDDESMSRNLYNPDYQWHVYPEWGAFFEYRFTPGEFKGFLQETGYEILESVPLYQQDGLYHDFGRLFLKHENWKFTVYFHGKLLNKILSLIPFFHNHMHLCVVRKPE